MIDVVMPQMGESIVEGTLTKWLKKPGETIGRDEPLFEISTDKVDTEIPSPAAGTLAEVLIEEGKTVGINTVVARTNDGASAASAAPQQQQAEAPAPPPPAAPAPQAAPVAEADGSTEPVATVVEETAGPLSPLVRKMARENNIDLSQVKGTGAGNRITKQDLETYLASKTPQQRQAEPPAPPAPTPAPAPAPVAAPVAAPAPPPVQAVATIPQTVEVPSPPRVGEAPGTRVEPMSVMRQKIAEHMVFSKHTSEHVTAVHKVDFTKVAKAR